MSSPKFAAYQPPSPQPGPSHLHPVANMVHQPQHQVPHHGAPAQPVNLIMNGMPSSQDELIFWDRIKKALEPTGTYDDFLKLLNLYSSEVLELQALVEQADRFLGDVGNGELLAQFKDLVGWDDRSQNPEFGPPDSIRTRAPDPQAPIYPDDGQGPSYRRLPDYVSRCLYNRLKAADTLPGDKARVLGSGLARMEGAQRRVDFTPDVGV